MDNKRIEIIKRLENCKERNKTFYERHPDILKNLNEKINALKNNKEYQVVDAKYVVAYAGGKIRDCNIGMDNKKINYKNTMTIEKAKEIRKEFN